MTSNYIDDILNKYPPLSHDELANLHAQGDFDTIILHNLRFAYLAANKYSTKYLGLNYEEIIEGAFYACTLACNRWDPTKSKITTYIGQYVRTIIKEMSNSNLSTIQKNTNYIWKAYTINNYIEEFIDEFGKEPTIDEIAKALKPPKGIKNKFSKKTIYNTLNLRLKSIKSMSEFVQNEKFDLYEIISDPEALDPYEETVRSDIKEILINLIGNLEPMEQEIITRRYINLEQYQYIIKDLGVEYRHFKKMELNALKNLRYELEDIDING